MEKMLDLFESGESIKDSPEATDLELNQGGTIVFGMCCVNADFQTMSRSHMTRNDLHYRMSHLPFPQARKWLL